MSERIKETFELEINVGHGIIRKVNIENDGIVAYKDWRKQSQQDLIEVIQKDLIEGRQQNWMPYANFEASIKWNLIDEVDYPSKQTEAVNRILNEENKQITAIQEVIEDYPRFKHDKWTEANAIELAELIVLKLNK